MQEGAEGLTLAQAAARLGVSTDTVRRRIKRGELSARQVQTKFGPAWEVLLGDAPGGLLPPDSRAPGSAPAPAAGLAELVGLVDQLARDKAELAGQVGFLQARVQVLQAELERAQLALEAPRAAEVDPEPIVALEAAPEALERPWWLRWLPAWS